MADMMMGDVVQPRRLMKKTMAAGMAPMRRPSCMQWCHSMAGMDRLSVWARMSIQPMKTAVSVAVMVLSHFLPQAQGRHIQTEARMPKMAMRAMREVSSRKNGLFSASPRS